MTTRVLTASPESKALPSGLYVSLFHGRDRTDAVMEDWGYPGPMIGPIKNFSVTYKEHVQIFFDTQELATEFFPDSRDMSAELAYVDDMIMYEGKYYGDFTVMYHDQKVFPVTPSTPVFEGTSP